MCGAIVESQKCAESFKQTAHIWYYRNALLIVCNEMKWPSVEASGMNQHD